MSNIYEDQAQYWSNYHFIDRSVSACVHLENENDRIYWHIIDKRNKHKF